MATKAEAIKAALEAIAQRSGGRLTPSAVVAEASNPASILHDQFTWSDEQAAAERRLDQARTLIRSVRVQFVVESRTITAPFYVKDPTTETNEQGYASLPRLLTDKEAARRAVVREFLLAESAMERARSVASVLSEDDAIDSLVLGVRTYRERIESGTDVSPAS